MFNQEGDIKPINSADNSSDWAPYDDDSESSSMDNQKRKIVLVPVENPWYQKYNIKKRDQFDVDQQDSKQDNYYIYVLLIIVIMICAYIYYRYNK